MRRQLGRYEGKWVAMINNIEALSLRHGSWYIDGSYWKEYCLFDTAKEALAALGLQEDTETLEN